MRQVYSTPGGKLFLGDIRKVAKTLERSSIQCIITSPPYWGLRDYGSPECQIGAEPDLDSYLSELVHVFELLNPVLKDDGTLWINVGDGYTSGNRSKRGIDKRNPSRAMSHRPRTPKGLKPKDLIGVPWRLALALQEAGWYLRCDVIWHKPNVMPESVKDRPTRSHEYLFMLTKSDKYYYDSEAIKEPNMSGGVRNKRSVWDVKTSPFKGAHFATYPCDLILPCLLASTRFGDCVLDPFFGSGTTGVVAMENGRNYVGVDFNPAYLDLAVDRLTNIDEKQRGPNGVH